MLKSLSKAYEYSKYFCFLLPFHWLYENLILAYRSEVFIEIVNDNKSFLEAKNAGKDRIIANKNTLCIFILIKKAIVI